MSKKFKSDFSRREIYKFVTLYCFSPLTFSLEECAKFYKISKWMAKQLIYTSISECIVEDNVVEILSQKAYQSACEHAYKKGIPNAPISTQVKYEKLKKARKSFNFSDEQAIEIALLYAVSPLSKHHFCEENGLTKTLFDRTIQRVIIENLVSDDIVYDLEDKSLNSSSNSVAVTALFEKLWKARMRYKQEHC